MKITNKSLISVGILNMLVVLNVSANSLEKPKTMDDMWKIIQAQQKQIDELKAEKQVVTSSTPVATATAPVSNKVPGDDVQKLARKTDVLSQEVENCVPICLFPKRHNTKVRMV